MPFIERMQRVDMRERVVDVPPQEVITSDNVVVSVDAVIYYEATDPQRLVYNVVDFYLAVTKLAQTNLRNVVGDMQLDEALTSRGHHQHQAARDPRRRHRQVGHPGRAGRDPAHRPAGRRHARHARADEGRAHPAGGGHHRLRRAGGRHRPGRGREAGGHPRRPRGSGRAAILDAEGEAQATKTAAEAEQFRQVAVAEGEAEAIRAGLRRHPRGQPTPDLIAVKYLETLQVMADGEATKIFLPAESTALMGALGGMRELLTQDGTGTQQP